MAGSFQRIIKRMQEFLFGDDVKENTEIRKAPPSSGRSHRGRDSHMRVLGEQQESGAKIFHQYPKQGKFRFPLEVDQQEPVMERKRERQVSYEHRKKDIDNESSGTSPVPAIQEREHNDDKNVETKKKNNNQTPSQKRTYFQGNDFKPEDIPSPVFGFQHAPLHPDYLKKGNDTFASVGDDDEHDMDEGEVAPDLIEETESEEEQESYSPFPNYSNVREEEATEDVDATENPADITEEDSSTVIEKTEEPTGAFMTEETSEAEITQEKESLSREERRRIQRKEKKAKKKQGKNNKNSVPFNVLMYTSDQKRRTTSKSFQHKGSRSSYQFPGLSLLNAPPQKSDVGEEALHAQKEQLEATLQNFNVNAQVIDVTKGPSVTRFEVQPAPGVKVNKITNLTDDIKLALAAKDLRMEAPIPGKNAIGIEVPNPKSTPVFLREILRRDVFTRSTSPLTVAMGLDISGNPILADLQKMPHGLIAGATGSGKSVCINSILLSLLYKADPEELKVMLIDPKMVELASYKDIPHLVTPVINDAKEATAGLKWAVTEMENRYESLALEGVRDIKKYNERMMKKDQAEKKMPYIVIVIDELADLMMVSPQDVEDSVCRIAQKARACGIHLLLATQRPSVDVITGLIKANIPSRTAFAVSSQADSRTILDMGGAERLIGKGDMLFHENGSPKPIRVQGTFVSDEEIDAVTDFVKSQKKPRYMFNREELIKKVNKKESGDELFEEACAFVAEQGSASASLLQRHFSIGYNRAAKLIDMMEEMGIVSESMGSKPRRILMSVHEIEENILA